MNTSQETEILKDNICKLTQQGVHNAEIARQLNVSASCITYWQKRLKLIKSKWVYKIHEDELINLVNQGLNDREIAERLGISQDGVYSYRMRHNIIRPNYNEAPEIKLTQDELEILLGTLMGDGTLECAYANPRYSTAHSDAQKDYSIYLADKLKHIGGKYHHYVNHVEDKRNHVKYSYHQVRTSANPALLPLYRAFYPNGVKVIPFELFKDFTAQSLAYMFMDDGCKKEYGYEIATCCFQLDELQKLQEFFMKKFNLATTIHGNNDIYIRKQSLELFTKLVEPYMCECTKYKLHRI